VKTPATEGTCGKPGDPGRPRMAYRFIMHTAAARIAPGIVLWGPSPTTAAFHDSLAHSFRPDGASAVPGRVVHPPGWPHHGKQTAVEVYPAGHTLEVDRPRVLPAQHRDLDHAGAAGSPVARCSTSAAGRARSLPRYAAPSRAGTAGAGIRAADRASPTPTTSSTGPTAARRAWRTSCCCAGATTARCTKVACGCAGRR
jgi:hypothetical protein